MPKSKAGSPQLQRSQSMSRTILLLEGSPVKRICSQSLCSNILFSLRSLCVRQQGSKASVSSAIAHWEGKHYIVVYAVTSDRVIVADPAIGQRTLSHAEFKAAWTGYALLLQPTALLKETEDSSTPFWRFFELVKPHWIVLLEVLAASILIQIFGLVTPLLTQLLLDRVLVQRSTLTLQVETKLEGQLNRLAQLELIKNQLAIATRAQQQQNQAQEVEKQAQIEQAQQNLSASKKDYTLQEEKLPQIEQARASLSASKKALTLADSRFTKDLAEVEPVYT